MILLDNNLNYQILDLEILLIRILLIISGLIFTMFGLIGIFIPGLPTTIFLILAAACFVRSSPTLYKKLINSPILGKYIQDYLEGKGMPIYAKVISIFMILLACFISSLILLSDLAWLIKLLIVALGIFGSIFIFKIPSRK